MKVINRHHFLKGVVLEIDNEKKLTWTVDANQQAFKYGTIRVLPGGGSRVLNPSESNDDFISLINLVFEFTGCGNLEIEASAEPLDVSKEQELINLIYNQPLERKTRLVWVNDCEWADDCLNRDPKTVMVLPVAETYGDLMRSLGEEVIRVQQGEVKRYEYPDSCWLFLRSIERPATADDPTDDQILYLRYSFDR